MDLTFFIQHPWIVLPFAIGLAFAVHHQIMRRIAPAQAPSVPSAWSIRPVAPAAPVERRAGFAVMLTGRGEGPINVLKALREATGLDLKHAKDLLDATPSRVLTTLSRQEAEHVAERLRMAGATVQVEEDEQVGDRFEVRLESPGDQPIHAIKLVREVSGRGLKESKDLVEAAPGLVTVCRSQEEADRIRRALEAGGARVQN